MFHWCSTTKEHYQTLKQKQAKAHKCAHTHTHQKPKERSSMRPKGTNVMECDCALHKSLCDGSEFHTGPHLVVPRLRILT